MNPNFENAPEIRNYQQIPVVRRRWMFVTLAMTLAPVGIYLLLSGPVYAVHRDQVVRYREKAARRIAWMLGLMVVLGVSRVLIQR